MEAGRRTFHKILVPRRPGASKTRATGANAVTPLCALTRRVPGGLLPGTRILRDPPTAFLTLSPPMRSTLFFPDSVGRFLFPFTLGAISVS